MRRDTSRIHLPVRVLAIVYLAAAWVVLSIGSVQPSHAEQGSTNNDGKPAAEATVKEQVKDVWNRDLFTDDWGGMRTYLHDHGIDIDLRLSQYGQGVASGGVNQNGEYGGSMDYRVNADLEKLFGLWKGLSFNMHARTRFGKDVNADAGALVLPNAGLMLPLPGDYSGTNITGLTVTQSLFDGRADVFFGKLDVIDLVTGFFPQIGYGQEGFWNINALVSAMPWFGSVQGLSLWGGGAWTVKNEMVQGGVIFAGTENVTTSWDFSPSFQDGVFMAGFYRFFWDVSDMPGYFLVFAGGSTKYQASNDPNDFINIPGQSPVSTDRKRPWDFAAYVYQVFWQAEKDPSRKAAFFIGGTGGPDNPQFSNWNLFATIEMFGLMASRPSDRMGVAGWVNGLSENFTDLVSPVAAIRDYTWGVELYYSVELSQWLHLTPDLQLVKNQNEGDDLAVIPGIRLVMDF
jgi:porin